MTAVNTELSPAQVVASIQSKLINLRNAVKDVQNLFGWTSGLAAADLATASGYSAADAAVVLSACADANALAQIYSTGLPPGTYPQPASAYVYAASQRQVIGPQ